MSYILSRHARGALEERQIELAWLERTLAEPDRRERDAVYPEIEHRVKGIPEFGNRVLHVIVDDSGDPERVVTVFFDRRLRGAR